MPRAISATFDLIELPSCRNLYQLSNTDSCSFEGTSSALAESRNWRAEDAHR